MKTNVSVPDKVAAVLEIIVMCLSKYYGAVPERTVLRPIRMVLWKGELYVAGSSAVLGID